MLKLLAVRNRRQISLLNIFNTIDFVMIAGGIEFNSFVRSRLILRSEIWGRSLRQVLSLSRFDLATVLHSLNLFVSLNLILKTAEIRKCIINLL